MQKKVLTYRFFGLLTVLTVIVLNITIGPFYIGGDQTHYYFIYDILDGTSLFDGFKLYSANIDSKEPIYYLISWLGSNLNIDKVYYMGFFNILLGYLGYRLFTTIGGHPALVYLIISFNFYSYVLFFSAERLKLGILFLLLATLLNSKKLSYILYIISTLTHAQMIMIISALISSKIKQDLKILIFELRMRKSFLLSLVGLLIASIMVYIILREHLFSKINSYFDVKNLIELTKLIIFFGFSYLYTKDKTRVILFFLPLFFFTLIFGQERVNFIGYFVFLYFAFQYKKGFNVAVILTTLYFFYSGLTFLSNVLKFGEGFNIN